MWDAISSGGCGEHSFLNEVIDGQSWLDDGQSRIATDDSAMDFPIWQCTNALLTAGARVIHLSLKVGYSVSVLVVRS